MTQPAPPDPPHRSRRAVFWVAGGAFLLVNAVGALAVRSVREREPALVAEVPALETSPRASTIEPAMEPTREPAPSGLVPTQPERSELVAEVDPIGEPSAPSPMSPLRSTAMASPMSASVMSTSASTTTGTTASPTPSPTSGSTSAPSAAIEPEPLVSPTPPPVVTPPPPAAPTPAPVAIPASAVAARAPVAPPPAPTRPRGEIYVPTESAGNARSGAALFASRCGFCHGRSASAVDPRRYTADQWSRYFATDRHRRRAPLGDTFSVSQLSDIKAFFMSRAADVRGARAAGVH